MVEDVPEVLLRLAEGDLHRGAPGDVPVDLNHLIPRGARHQRPAALDDRLRAAPPAFTEFALPVTGPSQLLQDGCAGDREPGLYQLVRDPPECLLGSPAIHLSRPLAPERDGVRGQLSYQDCVVRKLEQPRL